VTIAIFQPLMHSVDTRAAGPGVARGCRWRSCLRSGLVGLVHLAHCEAGIARHFVLEVLAQQRASEIGMVCVTMSG